MWERLKATGRAIKHRRMTFALVVAFLAIGVVGGLYAIQEGYAPPDGGQTRDGDHAWVEEDFEDQAFCSNCHVDIGTEIGDAATRHGETSGDSQCSFCHIPSAADEHAAAVSACTDCHNPDGKAGTKYEVNLTNDAHAGILASQIPPETPDAASQTCQSCHTHAAIKMTVVPDGAIPMQLGG